MRPEGFKLKISEQEYIPTKIEHLPGDIDVILNMDYLTAEDREEIIATLKKLLKKESERLPWKTLPTAILEFPLYQISLIMDGHGERRFFVKRKWGAEQENVNYILGRTSEDYLDPSVETDFDTKARYAQLGVLNEMVLSKKIKQLIALPSFQELAKKYGFAGLLFPEPIIAIIERKSGKKYLIYRYIKDIYTKDFDHLDFDHIAEDLRELFLHNGIEAHDLLKRQFMITEQNGQYYLVLIDTEAYTKVS